MRIRGGRFPTVTAYVPNFSLRMITNLRNFKTSQYNRVFNGLEVTAAPAAVEPLAE